VEGLLRRPDRVRVASSLALGIVPSGSGNGLAASLCADAGLPYSLDNAGFILARGGISPLDLASTFVAEEAEESWAPGSDGAASAAAAAADAALLGARPAGLWGARRWSFLSLEWGIVADIDIESEKLRILGGARFDV
jgi:sphingosine kinase